MFRKIFLVLALLLLVYPSFAETFAIAANGYVYKDSIGTNDYTSKRGEVWLFSYHKYDIDKTTELRIVFPKKAVIQDIKTNLEHSINYENSIVITLKGYQSSPYLEVEYVIEREKISWPIYLIPAFLIIPFMYILHSSKKFEKKPKTKKTVLKKKQERKIKKESPEKEQRLKDIKMTLSEKELIVFEELLKNKGFMNQNKIRHLTGIPKATLSRTIQSLEKKKIIEKQNIGNTNNIRVKKEFL